MNLLDKVSSLLERQTKDTTGDLVQVLKQVLEELPRQLLSDWPRPEPEFSDAQRAFIQKRLEQCLGQSLNPPLTRDWIFRLSREHALALLERLAPYSSTEEHHRWASDLQEISRRKRRIQKLQQKLDDLGSLSEEEKERLAEARRERERLVRDLEALIEEIGSFRGELKSLQKQRDQLERELRGVQALTGTSKEG